MFSSLDRVDIVLKEKEGRKQYVQTDHRTAEEIEQEPELSVLFALVRIVTARRLVEKGSPEPVVTYSAQSMPPEFLCRAIRAAGGRLTVGKDARAVTDEGETPLLAEVLAESCASLARRVAAEYDVELTDEGLETLEPVLAAEAGDVEEDEIAYWSAVFKLGSFGGEVIRAAKGGRWQQVESGTLPFALATTFRGSHAIVNPLGKAMKRFDIGEEDTLVALVRLVCSQR